MKKLTKTQVIAQVKKNGSLVVELYPSKCGPANQTWVKGFEVLLFATRNNEIMYTNGSLYSMFETLINDFSYYNCIPELGKRVHYYTNEKGTK